MGGRELTHRRNLLGVGLQTRGGDQMAKVLDLFAGKVALGRLQLQSHFLQSGDDSLEMVQVFI